MESARATSARTEAAVYLAAVVTYVVAGIAWKPLLNWMIGPLWVVTFVWFVPPALMRVLRRPQ